MLSYRTWNHISKSERSFTRPKMALACLACNTMEGSTDSFRMEGSIQTRSLSVRSDNGACHPLTSCWAKRPSSVSPPNAAARPTEQANSMGARVTPVTEVQSHTPRLTRCHAVRRDCSLFRNWSVEQVETAHGRQLCFNLTGRAWALQTYASSLWSSVDPTIFAECRTGSSTDGDYIYSIQFFQRNLECAGFVSSHIFLRASCLCLPTAFCE